MPSDRPAERRNLFRQGSLNNVTSRRFNTGRPSKYATLPSSNGKEYPRTYEQYKGSPVPLGRDEVLSARRFAGPEKVVNFSSTARSVIGGISAVMEGLLKVSSPGVIKQFTSKKQHYVRVKNAKIQVFEENEDEFYGNEDILECLLEIPFVEIRAIHYFRDNAKFFKVTFNSQSETNRGRTIKYEPHTLIFSAPNPKIIEDWVKAICAGCINTALFLQNIIEFFEQNNTATRDLEVNVRNKELFLRQMVDLNTLGRGQKNDATISAQRALSEHLLLHDQREEGEFWNRMAAVKTAELSQDNEEEGAAAPLIGLAAIQDLVNDSIRAGNLDLETEYEPERRASFVLPKRFSVRRPANGKVTKVRKKSGKSTRSGSMSSQGESVEGSSDTPPNNRRGSNKSSGSGV